jgi:hypothetical protein
MIATLQLHALGDKDFPTVDKTEKTMHALLQSKR